MWNALSKKIIPAILKVQNEIATNKKGRDLSQNLLLRIESLPDPLCHYYSYSL